MNISATYTPTESDIADGVIAFRQGLFTALKVGGVVIGVLGVVALVLQVVSGGYLTWMLLLLLFSAAMLGLRFWAPIQAVRKNPHMHGSPCEITITDTAYVSQIRGARSEVPWSEFRRTRSVGEQWVFEFGPSTAVTVPRRVFTDEQNAELTAFLRNRPARGRTRGSADE